MKKVVCMLLFISACSKDTKTVEVEVPVYEPPNLYAVLIEESVEACSNLPALVIYKGPDSNKNGILDVEERKEVEIICEYPETQVPDESKHHDNGNHYGCFKKENKHNCRKLGL